MQAVVVRAPCRSAARVAAMQGPAAAAAAAAAPAGRRRASGSTGAQQLTALSAEAPIVLQYERLVPCQLLRRYKRFLGDVQLSEEGPAAPAAGAVAAAMQAADASNSCTVVHVPNTGSMAGLLSALPAAALLSTSADPKRKYAHTLEFVQLQGGAWVGVHSAKANAMVRALLQAQALPGLPPYTRIQQEVKFGADGKSRVDFVLHWEPLGSPSSRGDAIPSSIAAAAATAAAAAAAENAGPVALAGKRRRGSKVTSAATAATAEVNSNCCYLEVKASTLAEDRTDVSCGSCFAVWPMQGAGRIAMFPDAVSERAQRHVRELTALAQAGASAALVFVVLRDDCTAWAPCHERDPAYGRLVREAAAAGVRLLPVVCALDEAASAVRFRGTLPVDLDYKWVG